MSIVSNILDCMCIMIPTMRVEMCKGFDNQKQPKYDYVGGGKKVGEMRLVSK